jgi:hypothetical protein
VFKRVFTWVAAAAFVLIGVILVLASAVTVAVATGLLPGGSCGGTLATGRVVNAQSDSWYLSSQFSQDSATINIPGRTILIGPTNLQIDGQTLATIPVSAKLVDVVVKGNAISFVADGRPVGTFPR